MSILPLCLRNDDDCYVLKKYTLLDRKYDFTAKNATSDQAKKLNHSCFENKLKQYKLVKSKNDDPEVLNVSSKFSLTLRIKSPIKSYNKAVNNNVIDDNCSNYLVSMARKRNNNVSSNAVRSKKIGPNQKSSKSGEHSKNRSNLINKVDAFHLLMGKTKIVETVDVLDISESNTKSKKFKNIPLDNKQKKTNIVKNDEASQIELESTKPLKEATTLDDADIFIPKKRKKLNDKLKSSSKKLKIESSDSESDNEKLSTYVKKPTPANKKENMLNYFEVKIDKDKDCGNKNKKTVAKIFNSSKSKTETKKKILKPKINNAVNIIKTKKECLNSNSAECDVEIIDDNNLLNHRPKRTIKKTIKYSEDFEDEDSSSDQIFTPVKKSKRVDSKTITPDKFVNVNSPKLAKIVKSPRTGSSDRKSKLKAKRIPDCDKTAKLAPIFRKNTPNKEQLEAKFKFLHSGVPDQIKKTMAIQKTVEINSSYFVPVVHVQQKTNEILDTFDPWNLPESNLLLKKADDDSIEISSYGFKIKIFDEKKTIKTTDVSICDVKTALKNIKNQYSLFPVFKTYKLLKAKSTEDCSDPTDKYSQSNKTENLVWTEKYKDCMSRNIVGNFNAVNTLRNWLSDWKQNKSDYMSQQRKARSNSSDSSDFYTSDKDSRDGAINNVLVVTGPCGSGKTSAIYAISNELSIKVLEINVSSKRTGKRIVAELQEATKSHKVNRTSGTPRTDTSQELGISKKVKECSKVFDENETNHDNEATKMSLILIDDADLVFEQDDGFVSGLTQLVYSAKRPVIIVTSDISCVHLQRFINSENVIKFQPLKPKMLGAWIDILCLAEKGRCWPNLGKSLVSFCHGDMRKVLNLLHFWIGGNLREDSIDALDIKENEEDTNEIPSTVDTSSACEAIDIAKPEESEISVMLNSFNLTSSSAEIFAPFNLFNIWWNYNAAEDSFDDENKSLNDISNVIDSISIVDMMDRSFGVKASKDLSYKPWKISPADSVADLEDLENFRRATSVHKSWRKDYLDLSLRKSCTLLFEDPYATAQRHREVKLSSHRILCEAIPQTNQLDRSSLSLDYWSQIRAMCRAEKQRSSYNVKRNNRFCHYLNNLKVSCSMDEINSVCDSLV